VEVSAVTISEFAVQTVRLDFVTVALTVTTTLLAALAILLALAAIPYFFYLKRRAEYVAREAAAKAIEGVERRSEAAAVSQMEQMLPILMAEYREIALKTASGEMADEIARAQNDPTDVDRDDEEGSAGRAG
jgi:hypothetical protein